MSEISQLLRRTLLKNGEPEEEEDLSGSETALSSSPSTKTGMAEGSELFKAVMNDYFFDGEDSTRVSRVELDRYNAKKASRTRDIEEHGQSRRCESCQAVITMCRCAMYGAGGGQRKFGHRVHWADEVWKKPLSTLFEYDSDSETQGDISSMYNATPKPILKHKATCIIVVSD